MLLLYLSILRNIFVQIAKCICSNCDIQWAMRAAFWGLNALAVILCLRPSASTSVRDKADESFMFVEKIQRGFNVRTGSVGEYMHFGPVYCSI